MHNFFRHAGMPIYKPCCALDAILLFLAHLGALRRYMMEVSRSNPEMRDIESLISGIQQVCTDDRCSCMAWAGTRCSQTGKIGVKHGPCSGKGNMRGHNVRSVKSGSDVLSMTVLTTDKSCICCLPCFSSSLISRLLLLAGCQDLCWRSHLRL